VGRAGHALLAEGGQAPLYVLEVPGGWTSRNGVRTGSTVELEGALKERAGQP
jgi:uncharacterized membrane protein (UPF0127 family)